MDVVLDEKLTASLMKDALDWEIQFGCRVICSNCFKCVQMQNHFTKDTIYHELHFVHGNIGYNPFVIRIYNNKFSGINIFPSSNSWNMMRSFDVYKNTVNISVSSIGNSNSQIEINNIRELLNLIKYTISTTIDESSYEWIKWKPYFDFLYNMTFWDAMMGNEPDEEIVIDI